VYLERLPANGSPEPQPEPGRLRPQPAPARLSPQSVLALQRTAGNAAVGRALAREPAAATAPAAAPAGGVDWATVWDSVLYIENGVPTANFFRQIGELGRIVPLIGAMSGAAADTIQMGQDLFGPTWEYEAPWTRGLLALRGAINICNNGLGHFNYVMQLAQDVLAPASGGTASPFTGGLNIGLALLKLVIDTAQVSVDSVITTMAHWNAYKSGPPAPGNQEEFDAWKALAVNYEANIVGDVVGMVFDGLDAVTAGIGHGNTIDDIVGFFEDRDGHRAAAGRSRVPRSHVVHPAPARSQAGEGRREVSNRLTGLPANLSRPGRKGRLRGGGSDAPSSSCMPRRWR
jgi:hypothetical protein